MLGDVVVRSALAAVAAAAARETSGCCCRMNSARRKDSGEVPSAAAVGPELVVAQEAGSGPLGSVGDAAGVLEEEKRRRR